VTPVKKEGGRGCVRGQGSSFDGPTVRTTCSKVKGGMNQCGVFPSKDLDKKERAYLRKRVIGKNLCVHAVNDKCETRSRGRFEGKAL